MICIIMCGQIKGINHGMLLGFSKDPYNFDDPAKGNRVYFTGDYFITECEVLVYYSSTEQIVCTTR